MMITNYTTLEYCEKRREFKSTWQVSPFDQGSYMNNIRAKLGLDSIFFLMIPTKPTLQGKGCVFPVTYNKRSDVMLEESNILEHHPKTKKNI